MLQYFNTQGYQGSEQKKYVNLLRISLEENELWNKYVRMC